VLSLLEIKKITTETEIENISKSFEFKPNKNDYMFIATQNEAVIDILVYQNIDKSTIIKYISNKANDFSITLGLVKSLLFLSDLKQTTHVVLPLEYKQIAKALNFNENNNDYIMKLDEYSSKCM